MSSANRKNILCILLPVSNRPEWRAMGVGWIVAQGRQRDKRVIREPGTSSEGYGSSAEQGRWRNRSLGFLAADGIDTPAQELQSCSSPAPAINGKTLQNMAFR